MRFSMLLLCAMTISGPSRADILLAGSFDEHLSNARVAGHVLVGLWLGEPRGVIALNPTRLALPARETNLRLCVTASTRDGEYWLHGLYSVQRGGRDIGDLLLESRYSQTLSAYVMADLGIITELKPDCDAAAQGDVIPVISGSGTETLVAMINSQRAVRVQAALRPLAGPTVADGKCSRYEAGRSTAFDTVCRFVLPAGFPDAQYMLVVGRRTRAGDVEEDEFAVSLSRPAK